ncbi:MAG: hypothetical protein IJT65_08340 [Eubacterium sp.]|nr:hypothetical protein [Eubacterium sp.]
MKKTLSVLLAVLMAVSCFSVSLTANAYNPAQCVSLSLNGTAYVTPVKQALDEVNAKRKANGVGAITLDTNLTNISKRRAAQLMLFVNSADEINGGIETLPSGDDVSTVLKDNNTINFSGYKAVSSASKSVVSAEFDGLESLSDVKSVGGAIFKFGNTYALYYVLSKNDAASPLTNVTDGGYKTTEALNIKNIKTGSIELSRKGTVGGYNLTLQIKASGYYTSALTVPNSQLIYTSSNPSIIKIKGTKAYNKKSGKIKLSAKNKSGTVIHTDGITGTVTTYTPILKKLSSPKKKQLKVTWENRMYNADGFEVQIATDKKFKKNKKTFVIKGRKKAAYTAKKLKSKKTYYVRVRAYINQGEGEKLYSPYTGKKTIKVK